MAEDKNYTNNKERPREDEELEIDLMEYVRKLWAARKTSRRKYLKTIPS